MSPKITTLIATAVSHLTGGSADSTELLEAIQRDQETVVPEFVERWTDWAMKVNEFHLWDHRELEPWLHSHRNRYFFPSLVYDRSITGAGLQEELYFSAYGNPPASETPAGERITPTTPFRIDLPLGDYWGLSEFRVALLCRKHLEGLEQLLLSDLNQRATDLLARLIEINGVRAIMETWNLDGDTQLIQEACGMFLGFMARPLLMKGAGADINQYFGNRCLFHLLEEIPADDPEFWNTSEFQIHQLTPTDSPLQNRVRVACWAISLARTQRPPLLTEITSALNARAGARNSAEDWTDSALALRDPEGSSMKELLTKTHHWFRTLHADWPPVHTEGDTAPEEASPRDSNSSRPSDPLPDDVAATRRTKRLGNFTITYPEEIAGEIDALSDGLAIRYSEREQWRNALHARLRPENAAAFVASILRWLQERTSLKLSDQMVSTLEEIYGKGDALVPPWFSGDAELWFQDDLKELLRAGWHRQHMSFDPSTNQATFAFQREVSSKSAPAAGNKQFAMPIPLRTFPTEGNTEERLAAIESALKPYLSPLREVSGEFFYLVGANNLEFFIAHEGIELVLVRHLIRSKDRRWFCDGMANCLALEFLEDLHGKAAADTTFAEFYDAESCRELVDRVDLRSWPPAENETKDREAADDRSALTQAHYYYATMAIREALSGQSPDFVRLWFDEIRKTAPRRRTVATVEDAYEKLADRDLAEIATVVTSE